MEDIINRIDKILSRITVEGYIPKEEAIYIIVEIMKVVEEDALLLDTFLNNINKNWSVSNKVLIEDFNKLLQYYGLTGNGGKRKMVVETKGKHIVRRTVSINNEKISKILKK